MTKTILITGANGTVGEAAGKYLCSRGHNVIGVSRSIEDNECYTETLSIDLIDKNNVKKLEEALEKVDAVFHLAWNLSEENFDTDTKWEGNMEMFRNVLEASKNARTPIFINGSSVHAGTGDINAYTSNSSLEETPEPYKNSIDPESNFDLRKENAEKLLSPLREKPDSPYGESKIETENMVRKAVESGGIKLGVNIRIGGVNEADKKALKGEPYYSTIYWSHKDIGRTLENILTADIQEKEDLHQFYGISDNKGRIFSIENSFTTSK